MKIKVNRKLLIEALKATYVEQRIAYRVAAVSPRVQRETYRANLMTSLGELEVKLRKAITVKELEKIVERYSGHKFPDPPDQPTQPDAKLLAMVRKLELSTDEDLTLLDDDDYLRYL